MHLVWFSSVDAKAALAMEGVHSFVGVGDVPGRNMVGITPVRDEPLFAGKEVSVSKLNKGFSLTSFDSRNRRL